MNSFLPGQLWLDTDGNPIEAHGGSVMQIGDTYYWYGENKSHTDGTSNIWHWGVNLYSSMDLYNWKYEGNIIPPNLEDKNSSLYPESKMDRPHILYNKETKKFVCWLKIMDDVKKIQSMTILTADDIAGPYTLVKEGFRPLSMDAGDFDLAVDEDGKAYYYFERVHSELICVGLTSDYLDVTNNYSTHFEKPFPPFVREAPAHFERNGKHYLITSGTTGYFPNPSEVAVADNFHGPFKVLGNPHRNDLTNTSYHSQISCVFKAGETYIAMADRWKPNHMDVEYEYIAKVFEKLFNPNFREEVDLEKFPKMKPGQVSENTKDARYVWLPIKFEGDMAYIDFLDEWKLDFGGNYETV